MSKEYEFRKIPTHRIRPNPKNPRKVYQPGLIEAMEASLRALGQLTAMKVRNLSEAERAQDPDHDVEVMGGDIRLAGGLRAGLPTMDCQVYMNLTPDEAELIGDMDNKDHNMVWLAWYEAIERRLAKPDQPSQDQVGKEMEASQQLVSQAAKTLKYLNPASRAMIYHSVVKPDGDYEVSPKMVLKLADLADSQKIESALKVAIRLKMTVADAKKLAEWVQAGNPAETYTRQKAVKPPKAKKTPPSDEALAKAAEFGRQIGLAEGRGEDTKPAQDQLNAYLAEIKTLHANGNNNGPIAQLNLTPTHSGTSRPMGSTQVTPSHPITSPEGTALLRQALENLKTLFKPAPAEAAQPSSEAEGASIETIPEPKLAPTHSGTSQLAASAQVPENFFLDWLAGVSVIHQIRKKVEKREPLTKGEILILAGDKFGIFLGWMIKILLMLVIGFFKLGWKLMKETYKAIAEMMPKKGKLGKFFKTVKLVLLIAFWGAVAWLILDIRQNGLWHPINLIRYKFHLFISNKDSQPQETQSIVPTPAPQSVLPKMEAVVSRLVPKKETEKPAPTSSPIMVYQPAISFAPSVEDPKILEFEINAYSDNSIAKDFPVTPDESMPGDLAVTRMQGVMDADKYTMMIGSDKRIVLGINVTTTTLMIHHKSADPFNVLWADGQTNIVLEDIKAIHISEIDTGTKTITVKYQFSVISEGAKYPLTIQCNSPDDLNHLVSAVEYFIRNSRLGHDTPLTGMPYPLQGLRLDKDSMVLKLWADSPADKAGLQLGDHLWSIGKATKDQQEKKVFESALASLPVTLLVASDSDWTKAKIAAGMGNTIHPKLRKVILGI